MEQVRHGCATNTHAIRATIQQLQASVSELSRELGINSKPVAKWRKRQTVKDGEPGPREPRSTVLSQTEEGMIIAFWRHTLLPLDDFLCPSAIDSPSDTVSPASVSAKAWHIALTER